VYFIKKEYDGAVADFSEAIKLDPRTANGYVSRGLAYRAKGDYDRAIADQSEALRLNPG